MWLRTTTGNNIATICRLPVEIWHITYDDLPDNRLVEQMISQWYFLAIPEQ